MINTQEIPAAGPKDTMHVNNSDVPDSRQAFKKGSTLKKALMWTLGILGASTVAYFLSPAAKTFLDNTFAELNTKGNELAASAKETFARLAQPKGALPPAPNVETPPQIQTTTDAPEAPDLG